MLAGQEAKTSVKCAPGLNSYNEDRNFPTMAVVFSPWWASGFVRGDNTTGS